MFFYYLEEVKKKNMFFAGYPKKNIIFAIRDIKKTHHKIILNEIALLRLDLERHSSIKYELKNLSFGF